MVFDAWWSNVSGVKLETGSAFTFTFYLYDDLLFSCYRQTKIHNIGATLVGVDKFGNKYYENMNAQHG